MPHFIVTYGPAASGKGHIRDKYLSYLCNLYPHALFNETNTFEANIDSYVEKDERYIQRSIEATQEFITACQGTQALGDCLQAREEARDALVTKLQENYFDVRRYYMYYMDQEIIKAMQQEKHIILETTGSFGPPTWIFDFVERALHIPSLHECPYIFTVVFPVVLPKTIQERAVDRFLGRAHRVLENDVEGMYMKEPPRLPSIVELREKSIPQSHDNFVKILADDRFQHVLLYNNNESCGQNCYMLDLNDLRDLRSRDKIGVTKQILAQGGLGDRVTLEIVKKIMQ